MNVRAVIFFTFIVSFAAANAGYTQNNEYQLANRLIQQQQYEEALPILVELHNNNPAVLLFFDRYLDCLVNLKKFDEAISAAEKQISENRYPVQATLKLAEVHHLKGDREKALQLWNGVTENNPENIQNYYSAASSMVSRREYNAAIALYKKAQQTFNNYTLFLNELGDTYMQAGMFEESVREFYKLIIESPEQMGVVQHRFLRMQDNQLFEIAAFELEDTLLDLSQNHIAYSQLYQLLIWLLVETEEYQRALVFATRYESQTSHTVYSLFSLANQFLSSGRFELTEKAYGYYIENGPNSIRYRAMEDLAAAYILWARYLEQHSLGTFEQQHSLYEKAFETSTSLMDQNRTYDRADRVFAMIIDLSLDPLQDVEKAGNWFRRMQILTPEGDEAYTYYARGRLALFEKDFITARQALTRADRATDSSDLSEKARYYLSLSDFYSGDYEFASIQLRSLERRNTSFHANDAIKLRMWIKNGERADTTGSLLQTIGQGMHAIHTGSYTEALTLFEPILAATANPFADDITVELSGLLPPDYNSLLLLLLSRQIEVLPASPLRERMLWNRALLAEQMTYKEPVPSRESLFMFDFLSDQRPVSYNERDLENLYEEVLMEFPDGFYAPYVREKLRQLQPVTFNP